ncbi:MAG: Sec-independent protein translocase, TatC subunit [Candidatus Collierbacteria bacterium GW2011_GWB1_44_6]|uniref:Sec-independent protein translocase, TatC subunit n=1 Tax=Candidatus Collierbacteria bacterium GW2011_GWB1_44_6 TaxID=1618384 RepID=A0A0G1LVA2_9BACT|nr:MAG: Sec-independent protein translocase, TatC subunit [Candidatus Collierbacteria bacterium GW2011_GWB1_44_6]
MPSDIVTPKATTQDSTPGSVVDDTIAKFLPYLQEIQKKLTILLVVILISALSGFLYYQKILTFIMRIFNLKGITVVLSSPYQFIDLAINTGIATGVIVAFPLFIYYLLGFLKPALGHKEFKLITRLVPLALGLFIFGFGFGAWVMQLVINIFSKTAIDFSVTNIWDISRFFSQTLIMGVSLGLIFEIPVLVTLLIKLRILKKQTIAKNRRLIYPLVLIMAAFLPPTDIVSLGILTFVPITLFEVALLLNKSI